MLCNYRVLNNKCADRIIILSEKERRGKLKHGLIMENVIMGKNKGPLEVIARLLGMDYISDLRNPVYLPAVRCVLNFMDISKFSADEWSHAANYILGNEKTYATAAEAVAGILDRDSLSVQAGGKRLKNYVWGKYMEERTEV